MQQQLLLKTCQTDDLLGLQDAADACQGMSLIDEGLPTQAVWSSKYKPLTSAEV